MPDKLVVNVDGEIARLVPQFLANRAIDVDKLRAALSLSHFEAIRATGHGLKGVGTSYGFPDISRLGEAIEEAASRCDSGAIALLVADLDGYLARLDVRYP
jgi:hypothetical protein